MVTIDFLKFKVYLRIFLSWKCNFAHIFQGQWFEALLRVRVDKHLSWLFVSFFKSWIAF